MTGRRRLYLLVGAGALLLAVVLVGVSIVAAGGDEAAVDTSGPTLPGAAETRELLAGIPQDGMTLGAADAPVTLVEYADVQCPFCAQWAVEAFPELVRDYVRPGQLRIEFRGLAFLGPDSESALRTVVAAGEQDKAWNVLELLLQNQGEENAGWVTEDLLRAAGRSVQGLDTARMLDARDGDAVTDELAESAAQAEASGVRGTPSFELGPTGEALQPLPVQSLDADAFRPAIDDLLGR